MGGRAKRRNHQPSSAEQTKIAQADAMAHDFYARIQEFRKIPPAHCRPECEVEDPGAMIEPGGMILADTIFNKGELFNVLRRGVAKQGGTLLWADGEGLIPDDPKFANQVLGCAKTIVAGLCPVIPSPIKRGEM